MKKHILFTLLFIGITHFVSSQTQIGSTIGGSGGNFGQSVSLSADGSILAVGAPYKDGYKGHVSIYRKVSGVWTQIGADIVGETSNDCSGQSVSLSANGNIIAIGAFMNNNAGGTLSGQVRVYQNISDVWTQIGIDIDGEAPNEYSGDSISLSSDGSTVLIGAKGHTGGGQVRVFKNVSGNWTKIGANINGEAPGNEAGFSVALSSDASTLAFGAPLNNGNGSSSGSIRVYKNVSGNWTKIGADIDGEAAMDAAGYSVSLSSDGSVVAFGAMGNDGNGLSSGSVRVYKNISGNWTKIGADIDGEGTQNYLGKSVSLSANGDIVAMGANINNGNGMSSTRVYQNISGVWVKKGVDLDGDYINSSFGYSIALTPDGNTLAVGATGNTGYVKVFDFSSAVLASDTFVLENTKIYPNPTKNELHISLEQGLTLQEVNIYSALGQFIKKEKTNTINVSSLSKGFYFIQIVTEKGKATHKILVE